MTVQGLTEHNVREWAAANGMVLVSRRFWVAAANAIRVASGHATAEEPAMTDAEAWRYISGGGAGG
ncbi:MAG TPA: hypothetical protein VHL81_02865 [Gemmatimonadales bacterium]|jgi:hypothetical protein|nr:hypothetical protein [Gemmatimonadales bacterium]